MFLDLLEPRLALVEPLLGRLDVGIDPLGDLVESLALGADRLIDLVIRGQSLLARLSVLFGVGYVPRQIEHALFARRQLRGWQTVANRDIDVGFGRVDVGRLEFADLQRLVLTFACLGDDCLQIVEKLPGVFRMDAARF